MAFATLNDITLHYRYRTGTGTPIVFLNSLGTDFRIWDDVIEGLSIDVPVLCIDKRGHGLSDTGEITMKLLVRDVTGLMDQLDLAGALICGVSVGGLIAQGVAASRPDLAASLVLCCTGAKIGGDEMWNDRISAVTEGGLAPLADTILSRWFDQHYRTNNKVDLAGYKNMLSRTPTDGYIGVCTALRDTDFQAQTAKLKLPTHCIAGTGDLSTPPALVQSLADLIQGSSFETLENCGHLPCIEAPAAVVRAIEKMHS